MNSGELRLHTDTQSDASRRGWAHKCDFVHAHAGDIGLVTAQGDYEVVGRFRAAVIDVVRAKQRGIDIRDVTVSEWEDLQDYVEIVLCNDPATEPDSPNVDDTIHEVLGVRVEGTNILVIDSIELLPQARGRGLGLDVVESLKERLGVGVGLVINKARNTPSRMPKGALCANTNIWVGMDSAEGAAFP